SHEQVRVGRELQAGQLLEAVPAGRANDDDPGRVGLADGCQKLGEERVPIGRVELFMRLVQYLEGDVARGVGVARRDLAPECRELRTAQREIFRAGVEVVFVEDDPE